MPLLLQECLSLLLQLLQPLLLVCFLVLLLLLQIRTTRLLVVQLFPTLFLKLHPAFNWLKMVTETIALSIQYAQE